MTEDQNEPTNKPADKPASERPKERPDDQQAKGSPPLSMRNAILLGVAVVIAMGFAWFFIDSGKGKSAGSKSQPFSDGKVRQKVPKLWDLTLEQRKAISGSLLAVGEGDKKAWIHFLGGDPDSEAFARSLEEVFRQAGWDVKTKTITKFRLKAGLYFFVAGEQEPPFYAITAYNALKGAGFDPFQATGYRQYYDEMKKKKPDWNGVELEPDQVYAIVIGPKPAG